MKEKRKKSKKIVSCIIVMTVLFLSVGGYFAYPALADIFLPQRHVIRAFANFGTSFQHMVDGLSENLEFIEMEGELEIDLDAFPKLKEAITVRDGGSNVNICFRLSGNKVYVSALQLFEEDFLAEINLSDISELKKSDISSQLPEEYEQYREACEKLDLILHEISKIDFKKHSDILSATSKDIAKGYTEILKNVEYERLDSLDNDITSYKIVILQQFAKQGNHAVIDEIYSDSKVLPYISILKTSVGIDKETLKDWSNKFIDYMGDIDFIIDIDEKTDTIKSLYANFIYNEKDACKLTLHFLNE